METFEVLCARCDGTIHITTDQQDLVRKLQEAKVRIICPKCSEKENQGTGN